MECLIGIKGADFVIVASDTTAGRSIMAMKKGKMPLIGNNNIKWPMPLHALARPRHIKNVNKIL